MQLWAIPTFSPTEVINNLNAIITSYVHTAKLLGFGLTQVNYNFSQFVNFHEHLKLKTRRHAILSLVHRNKTGIVANVHLVDQLAARKWDGIRQNHEATLNIMEIPDPVHHTVKTCNKAKSSFIFDISVKNSLNDKQCIEILIYLIRSKKIIICRLE